MERLRVLVLGSGFFGKNWLREVTSCPDCELAGVVSKHADLLASVGAEFSIPPQQRFATIAEGLDRAGAQAVVVALPEMVHKEAILAALGRGLHVLTEKPLAMTVAEAAEIVRAARMTPSAVVMVEQNYRWRRHTQTLRQALHEGWIGRIASITHEFCQRIVRKTTDGWREHMPHPYLHDMAIHHFDLLRAITGLNCREVAAVGVRPPWSWYRGIPGIHALLVFEQELFVSYAGTMVGHWFATPQEGIITVEGEGGTLRLEADSKVRWYREGQVEVVAPVETPFTDTAYTLQEFLAAIRDRRQPETCLEDNVHSFAMVAAAIAAVETGQRVAVAPLVAQALGGNGK